MRGEECYRRTVADIASIVGSEPGIWRPKERWEFENFKWKKLEIS